jgi:hypothetical protein
MHLEPTIGFANTIPVKEVGTDKKNATGFRAGLGLRYTNSPLVLTTGLFYQSAGYQYSLAPSVYTISGTTLSFQPTVVHTRAHFLTLPVTAGLRIGLGENGSIIPSVGLEAACLLAVNETRSNESPGQPAFSSNKSGIAFRDLSLYGLFQVRYQLAVTDNTTLFIAPVVRRGLYSVYGYDYTYSFVKRQYFLMLGADAGVSIRL